jgi:hypothetical protein
LLDFKFIDWLDPRNVLFKVDDVAARMNFFSLQEGFLDDGLGLDRAKESSPDL